MLTVSLVIPDVTTNAELNSPVAVIVVPVIDIAKFWIAAELI